MWEGSTVTWGANEHTPATGVKSEQVQDRIDRLTKALERGKYTDETSELLQYELAKINDFLKSLEPDKPLEPTTEELIEAFNKGLK